MYNAIEVERLKKSFGSVEAVKDLSFTVKSGSLFAFLGTNGAGKSTTINILTTVLKKDGGRVSVCGMDLDGQADKIREKTGVVYQSGVLDERLSVAENLRARASLYSMDRERFEKRAAYLTEKLDMGEILKRRYGRLSGGQKRKADVARALINEPEILFLDEPTTGLDPKTRRLVWDTVREIREQSGTTVVLTTHYMEEAASADDVMIIDGGAILAGGTPARLKDEYAYDVLRLYGANEEAAGKLSLKGLEFARKTDYIELRMKDEGVLPLLNELCGNFKNFEFIKGDMDTVFLSVTGKRAREDGDND